MTDRNDETGKGPGKPGDGPRRPHATIDLKATEVSSQDKAAEAAAPPGDEPRGEQPDLPPPPPDEGAEPPPSFGETAADDARAQRDAQRTSLATHAAAGVTGAAATLAAAGLLGLFSGDQKVPPAVDNRIATLEQQVQRQAGGGDLATKLTQTEARLKQVEQQARNLAGLNEAQSKLAASVKTLETRSNAPELTNRLTKMETAVAALSANDGSGQAAALADKLTGLEKQVSDAAQVSKAGSEQLEGALADMKKETGTLSQRIDRLKSDIDTRLKGASTASDVASLSTKVAALERDMHGFLKSETERSSNAKRVLLALEIANLQRTMDRGDRYTEELKAVRKLAGDTLNLAPLERYAQEGAPTLPALTQDFRKVANAAMDAESEPADGSVLDRLMSGARSVVRVRKAGYDANDTSTEAVLGRMETALKEGRLDEVQAQAGKLPPKAELAAEDWLKKVEARRSVDKALADIQMAMKTSLTAGPAPAESQK